ncbi:MAG: type II toxin-antitoxin system VapC family toxin [Novosphingobium sp.]
MPDGLILVDTNVIVAALAEDHQHHAESLAVFTAKPRLELAVAAHCYAEAFTTLTRRGVHAPFKRPPALAWAALESVAATTRLVGLTPAQSFAAVRDFAAAGHIGARIYDFLIARAADAAGAKALVTWNTGHFEGLIEGLAVRSPVGLLAA